jgi:hypothetical protein
VETPSRLAASEGLKNWAEELTTHLCFADRSSYRGGPRGQVNGVRALLQCSLLAAGRSSLVPYTALPKIFAVSH